MSKFCFLILFTILSPGTIKSQLTNNIWYFGTNAGLDFSTSPPTAITSPLITVEGTATICNQAGNLLFYTNGVSIWDRTHTIMPNGEGLIGGLSSTQAAMIVPLPGSISRYYVFTSTEYESDDPTKPLAYSIVDMCLNDGRGDIESGAKNIIFHPDCGEKLTAAKHTNGTDIWILSHEVNSNRLLAFQLTAYGLITTPVATSIGAVHSSDRGQLGVIKASHNGKKVVCINSVEKVCELYDFDATTGVFSNHIDLTNYPGLEGRSYGAEFSLSDTMLYITVHNLYSSVVQINLNTGRSVSLMGTFGGTYGALQLGIDGKMYLSRTAAHRLSVIHYPELHGNACNFVVSGPQLLAGTECALGLPNLIPYSFFPDDDVFEVNLGEDTILCEGDELVLDLSHLTSGDTDFFWSTGSSASQETITTSGAYWVEVTKACVTFRDTVNVAYTGQIISPLGNDTIICDNAHLILDVPSPGATYVWSNNTTDAQIDVSESGDYSVTVSNACGTYTDDIYVEHAISPQSPFGNDTSFCKEQPLLLSALNPGSMYFWSTGSTDPHILINDAGAYWVEVMNFCGVLRSEIQITVEEAPVAFLGYDKLLCDGQSVVLDASNPNTTYHWSDGSFLSYLEVNEEGTYAVTVSNNCGVAIDEIFITVISRPDIFLGNDTLVCIDQELILYAQAAFANFLWSDGSTDSQLAVTNADVYSVTVSNQCGVDYDEIVVEGYDCSSPIYVPNIFSPNGDGINDVFAPVLKLFVVDFEMQIFDRWGAIAYKSNDMHNAWTGTVNGRTALPGVYVYHIEFILIDGERKDLYGSVTLLR